MELFKLGSLAVSKCAECKRFTLHVADNDNNARCSFCDPVYKAPEVTREAPSGVE